MIRIPVMTVRARPQPFLQLNHTELFRRIDSGEQLELAWTAHGDPTARITGRSDTKLILELISGCVVTHDIVRVAHMTSLCLWIRPARCRNLTWPKEPPSAK